MHRRHIRKNTTTKIERTYLSATKIIIVKIKMRSLHGIKGIVKNTVKKLKRAVASMGKKIKREYGSM